MLDTTRRHLTRTSLLFLFLVSYLIVLIIPIWFYTSQYATAKVDIKQSEEFESLLQKAHDDRLNNLENYTLPSPNWDGASEINESLMECPDVPPGLVGRIKLSGNVTPAEVYNGHSLERLRPGGYYSPSDCHAREKLAVIVPYRGRRRQLVILLFHLHNILQRQQRNYAIFVVEMAFPTVFNRGLLANAGYITARQTGKFSCIIVHDVDLLPVNDHNIYTCGKHPRHLNVNSSKYGYNSYVGGVTALRAAQYEKINGFSNAYFGWGKEDDDLYKRMTKEGYRIERPAHEIGIYEEIRKSRADFSNPNNPFSDSLLSRADKRMKQDGVRRVLYRRLTLEYRQLFTWVYISTSELDVMKFIYAVDPELKKSYDRLKLPK
ncbi:beta-1,4-galactosyltransferase 4-like isoform X2 [Mya arenaria]|uniref:beta-1,4-galactosyltransferase 4-like isoform X2 n=1 Tax=Mya arenaria TaxID=6604 RepID=UPI0022DF985C|nr:beta-1,4-galactosyltransferase 4-like isoform X2 [Mya arenaria]